MRETQEDAFPDRVTIKRRVMADDGFGGFAQESLKVIGSDIPARVTQAQVQAFGQGLGRDLDIEKWTIRMPHGTPVKDSDWVYWGDYIIEVETIKPRSYATAVSIQGERIKGVSGDSGEMD